MNTHRIPQQPPRRHNPLRACLPPHPLRILHAPNIPIRDDGNFPARGADAKGDRGEVDGVGGGALGWSPAVDG